MDNRCNGCETQKGSLAQIPFVAYEASEQQHRKRENKLLFIIIFLITALIFSNAVWFFYKQTGTECSEKNTIEKALTLSDNDGDFEYGNGFLEIKDK